MEVGWVVAGALEDADRQAVDEAREEVLQFFRCRLPEFRWEMPLLERSEAAPGQRIEPIELLDYGVTERNIRHWDFTILITPCDLVSHSHGQSFAVVSRSLESAVVSTSRIDPLATQSDAAYEERVAVMHRRLANLISHCLGQLFGLSHADEDENLMAEPESLEDLDRTLRLGDDQLAELQEQLYKVADRRLEEHRQIGDWSLIRFYLVSSWINRRELASAVRQAEPWQFPIRLSRLTTAAVSTMLILLITAEAWDLGLRQSPLAVTTLSLVTLVGATAYVLVRQRLLVQCVPSRTSEQRVVTNVSTLAIVLLGMLTTYTLLWCLTVLLATALFHRPLIESWAPAEQDGISFGDYATLASFTASLGLFIGALGASFEQQHYFRHVTHVDEEIG